eukprot:jgi/Chrzof1/14704/Cz09g12200.t1
MPLTAQNLSHVWLAIEQKLCRGLYAAHRYQQKLHTNLLSIINGVEAAPAIALIVQQGDQPTASLRGNTSSYQQQQQHQQHQQQQKRRHHQHYSGNGVPEHQVQAARGAALPGVLLPDAAEPMNVDHHEGISQQGELQSQAYSADNHIQQSLEQSHQESEQQEVQPADGIGTYQSTVAADHDQQHHEHAPAHSDHTHQRSWDLQTVHAGMQQHALGMLPNSQHTITSTAPVSPTQASRTTAIGHELRPLAALAPALPSTVAPPPPPSAQPQQLLHAQSAATLHEVIPAITPRSTSSNAKHHGNLHAAAASWLPAVRPVGNVSIPLPVSAAAATAAAATPNAYPNNYATAGAVSAEHSRVASYQQQAGIHEADADIGYGYGGAAGDAAGGVAGVRSQSTAAAVHYVDATLGADAVVGAGTGASVFTAAASRGSEHAAQVSMRPMLPAPFHSMHIPEQPRQQVFDQPHVPGLPAAQLQRYPPSLPTATHHHPGLWSAAGMGGMVSSTAGVGVISSRAGIQWFQSVNQSAKELLKLLGLEEYEDILEKNKVDMAALQLMSEKHLLDLGLPIGAVVKIKAALQQ